MQTLAMKATQSPFSLSRFGRVRLKKGPCPFHGCAKIFWHCPHGPGKDAKGMARVACLPDLALAKTGPPGVAAFRGTSSRSLSNLCVARRALSRRAPRHGRARPAVPHRGFESLDPLPRNTATPGPPVRGSWGDTLPGKPALGAVEWAASQPWHEP